MPRKPHTLALLFPLLVTSVAAHAERSDELPYEPPSAGLAEELKWLYEEQIAVTATKSEEQVSKTGASITVIDDRTIRSMGARSLMDILRMVPGIGVTVDRLGFYELEVRGINSKTSSRVQVMIDNIPISNMHNGRFNYGYNNFIVDNIKRVEVIRGPVSGLHGANAFLAMINVITKRADDLDGYEFSVGGGSYGTQKYNFLFGKRLSDFKIAGNFNFYDTNGHRGDVDRDSIFGTAASTAPGDTDYWVRRYDFDLKLEYRGFSLQGRYTRNRTGPYVGLFHALNDESKQRFESYFLNLGYRTKLTEKLGLDARLYRVFDHDRSYFEGYPEGTFGSANGILGLPSAKIARNGLEANLTAGRGSHMLLFGVTAEYQRQYNIHLEANICGVRPLGLFQDISSWCNWNRNVNREFYAAYLQDIWDINDQLRLIAGARYDHYTDFGNSFNPRASLIWEFRPGYDLRFHYGTAFRAPTFEELYEINNVAISGNPNLDPEEVETFEISLGWNSSGSLSGRITAFQNDIDDAINPASQGVGQPRLHDNIGELRSRGVEVELIKRFRGGSHLAANYTYQDTEDRVADDTLPDVPEEKANIMFNYRISRYLNLYTDLFLKSSMPRAKGDTRNDLPGYGVVNMALTAKGFIPGLEGLEMTGSVYNLFDKEYDDPSPINSMPSDYPRPERSLFIDLRYAF